MSYENSKKQKVVDFDVLRKADAVGHYELERYSCGELSSERRHEIETLLETDAALKNSLDELEAERKAFLLKHPPARLLAEARAKEPLLQKMSKWWFAAPALSAACALALFVALPGGESTTTNRRKGSEASLGFYVQTASGARAGVEGEKLRKGDRIQLRLKDAANARSLVVVGIDGAGVMTTYEKRTFDERQKGAPKERVSGESLRLDATLGAERFFAIYSQDSVEKLYERVKKAAQKRVSEKADLTKLKRLSSREGDQEDSFFIVKVAP